MGDLLTKQVEKLKTQAKVSYLLAGSGLAIALIFGILWLSSGSKSLDQKPNSPITKAILDTIDYKSQITDLDVKQESYIKTIDSLKTALLSLTDTVTVLKINQQILASATISEDYVDQMLENAKKFSSTDCNKSLAFLYAAKKVANMEKRVGPNIDAIQIMIKKCEASIFGENPSASTE